MDADGTASVARHLRLALPDGITGAGTARPDLDARRGLIAAFAGERERILKEIWHTLEHVPSYEMLSEAAADEVRVGVALVFDILTSCLSAGRGLTSEEAERLGAIGRARARQGIPLESVVRGFRAGFACSMEHLRRIAGDNLEHGNGVVILLVEELAGLHTSVENAIRDGYAAETEQPVIVPFQARARFVESVLEGSDNEPALRERLRRLGHEFTGECGLLIVVPEQGTSAAEHKFLAAELSDALQDVVEALVRTVPVPHLVVLTVSPPDLPTALDGRLAPGRGIVLARAVQGQLTGLGDIYRRLRPIVQLTEVVADRDGLLRGENLALYELAAQATPQWAAARMREAHGPVLADARAREWLETIEALFSEGWNTEAAARGLYVHAQTIHYRLRAIRKTTGLRVREPGEQLRLALTLALWRVHNGDLPPLGDPSWSRHV